jgi:hypothetical protein
VRESKTSKICAIFSAPNTLLKAALVFHGNRPRTSLISTSVARP